MSETFLISDPHFGHKNVINFGERPYEDVDAMKEDFINKWNNKVGKRDTVICLGDWGWSSKDYAVAKELNGMIRLVMGNHDPGNLKLYINNFHSVHGSLFKAGMLLVHIPVMMDGYHNYDWIVHGHIHHASQNIPDLRYINVNMDVWEYEPGDEYSPIHIEDVQILARARKAQAMLQGDYKL